VSEFVAEVRELVSEMNEVEADRRKELVNVQPVEYASFDNVWGMPIDAFIPFQSTSSNIQWAATDVLESVNTPQLRALFKSQPKRRRIIESESETEEFEDRGGIAPQLEGHGPGDLQLLEWTAKKWFEAKKFLISLSAVEECYFSIANVSLEGRNVYFDTFLTKPMIKKWQQEPEAG